jgi:non-canonical poly(A) RNA polymerase PAPD5/7
MYDNIFNNTIIDQKIIKNSLKKDILEYQQYIKNNIKQYADINQKIIDKLQTDINKINSNYKAKLYGSRATNLCLMWSDIDIVIYPEKKKDIGRSKDIKKEEDEFEEIKIDFLDKLNMILNNDIVFVEEIKYLNKAKVPIIKIKTTSEYNNTMIDITLQTKDHFGLKCVSLINSFIKEFESLEPLVFPLKTMLKFSELNDPYNGGLSSYALILMIVNFLKLQKKMSKSINIDKIGDLFYDFLFFYGGRKDSNYIDIDKNTIVNNNTGLVYISDPLNKNNNVGKASFKFIEVKLIFLMSLQILNEPCFCKCHYMEKFNKENIQHNYLIKIFTALKRGK